VAFVPMGQEHSFRVCDEAPARMLALLTPGGFEKFFREMAAGASACPRTRAECVLWPKHINWSSPERR